MQCTLCNIAQEACRRPLLVLDSLIVESASLSCRVRSVDVQFESERDSKSVRGLARLIRQWLVGLHVPDPSEKVGHAIVTLLVQEQAHIWDILKEQIWKK